MFSTQPEWLPADLISLNPSPAQPVIVTTMDIAADAPVTQPVVHRVASAVGRGFINFEFLH